MPVAMFDMIEMGNGQQRYRKDGNFFKKADVPAEVLERLTVDNIVDENGNVVVDNKNEDARKVSEEDQKKLDAKKDGDTPDPDADGDPEPSEATPSSDLDSDAAADDETPPAPDDDADSLENADDDQKADSLAAPPAPETAPKDPDEDEDVPEPPKKSAAKKAPAKRQSKEPRFKSKVPQSHPGMGFPRVNGKTVDIFDNQTPHTHVKLVGGYTVPLSLDSFNMRTEKEITDKLVEMGFDLIDFSDRANAPEDDGLTDEKGNPDDDDDDGLTDDHV